MTELSPTAQALTASQDHVMGPGGMMTVEQYVEVVEDMLALEVPHLRPPRQPLLRPAIQVLFRRLTHLWLHRKTCC